MSDLKEMSRQLTWYNSLTFEENNNHKRCRTLMYAQTKGSVHGSHANEMKNLSCHQRATGRKNRKPNSGFKCPNPHSKINNKTQQRRIQPQDNRRKGAAH
jgi:hypothetical protein